jgi:hypothetical protein
LILRGSGPCSDIRELTFSQQFLILDGGRATPVQYTEVT